MVGYSEAALLARSFADITYGDDLQTQLDLTRRLFRREIPSFRLRERYVKTDLKTIWVSLTASLISNARGEPLHGLFMIEDITEMKRNQEEAIIRQKLEGLGLLAGGIAHDFNNLLGSILTEAELAQSDLGAGNSPSEEIARIKTVAIRGSEIVRQLMIFAGQGQSSTLEPIALSRLTEEMLELTRASISKYVVLQADLDENLPDVWGNPPQLRQVLLNLVINASEAIGDREGVIRVRTSRVGSGRDVRSNDPPLAAGDYVQLEVADTGCGLTEEAKSRIFDPFFSTKFAGRGLGLALVQGIVRAHGGAIDVVSTPGRGTSFLVRFPCVPDATQVQNTTRSPSAWPENRLKA
jgi:PAS domain S-box-containing protein